MFLFWSYKQKRKNGTIKIVKQLKFITLSNRNIGVFNMQKYLKDF